MIVARKCLTFIFRINFIDFNQTNVQHKQFQKVFKKFVFQVSYYDSIIFVCYASVENCYVFVRKMLCLFWKIVITTFKLPFYKDLLIQINISLTFSRNSEANERVKRSNFIIVFEEFQLYVAA